MSFRAAKQQLFVSFSFFFEGFFKNVLLLTIYNKIPFNSYHPEGGLALPLLADETLAHCFDLLS